MPGPDHNSRLTPEVFLEHVHAVRGTARKLSEAQADHRNAMKRAKAAGVNNKAMVAAIAMLKEDQPVVEAHHRDLTRYLTWLGSPLGTQGSLFGASDDAPRPTEKAQAEHAAWAAREAGYEAGASGTARDQVPYEIGSPLHAEWDAGWSEGQARIIADLGTGQIRKRGRKGKGNPEERAAA